MATPTSPRGPITAGVLAVGVVVVLGFGSGIGLVSSRGRAGTPLPGSATFGAGGRSLGTVVQAPAAMGATSGAAGDSSGGGAMAMPSDGSGGGRGPMAMPSDGSGGAVAGDATPTSGLAMDGSSPTSSAATSPSSAVGGAAAASMAGSCTPLLTAMLRPFVVHVEQAHLEEPVSQQAADVLNLGQYLSTHLALVEQVAAPALVAVLQALSGLAPLVAHVEKAHLAEPLPQQIADILDLGQYLSAHTVLVAAVVAPTGQALTC